MSYESRIAVRGASSTAAPGRAGDRTAFLWIVVAAVAVGAAIRFCDIGSRALWLDESYSAWFSELGWHALWFESPRYETHPPFYYSLLKLWRSVVGDDAAALRGLSALAGLAAIPIAAFAASTAARLTGSRRPLLFVGIACALFACSPRLMIIAQDARPYALLLTSYALALVFWLRLTLSFRSGEHPEGRIGDWAGLGAATALTLWLHFLGILYAGALFGALLLTSWSGATRARWTRLAVVSASVLLSYLPCLLMLLGRSSDWNSGWVVWDPSRLPGALLDLYGLYRLDEPVTPIAARILFALLIAVGLRQLWRGGERQLAAGLASLILLPPLAAAMLSAVGHPVFVPRTLVAVLAPAYLVAAYALTLPGRFALTLGSGVALIFMANLGQALARPSLEAWDEVAATLRREMRPGDVIWVYPNDTALPLGRSLGSPDRLVPLPSAFPALRAAGRRPAGSPAVVAVDGPAARAFAATNQPRPGATVWLVVRATGLFDPDAKVAKTLAEGRRPGRVRRWGEIELHPLHPR